MATVKSKILLILIFLSVFAAVALAVESDGSMKIYAVTTDGEGLVATLHLEIEPGREDLERSHSACWNFNAERREDCGGGCEKVLPKCNGL